MSSKWTVTELLSAVRTARNKSAAAPPEAASPAAGSARAAATSATETAAATVATAAISRATACLHLPAEGAGLAAGTSFELWQRGRDRQVAPTGRVADGCLAALGHELLHLAAGHVEHGALPVGRHRHALDLQCDASNL